MPAVLERTRRAAVVSAIAIGSGSVTHDTRVRAPRRAAAATVFAPSRRARRPARPPRPAPGAAQRFFHHAVLLAHPVEDHRHADQRLPAWPASAACALSARCRRRSGRSAASAASREISSRAASSSMPGSDSCSSLAMSSRSSQVPSTAIDSSVDAAVVEPAFERGGGVDLDRREPCLSERGCAVVTRTAELRARRRGRAPDRWMRRGRAGRVWPRRRASAAAQVVLPTPPLPPMKWKRDTPVTVRSDRDRLQRWRRSR